MPTPHDSDEVTAAIAGVAAFGAKSLELGGYMIGSTMVDGQSLAEAIDALILARLADLRAGRIPRRAMPETDALPT